MNMRMSIIHFLELRTYSPFWYAITEWHSKRRFGARNIRFPIMGVFGGRDTMASQEGLDKIIECNEHYQSGLSKIAVIDGAPH